MTSGQLTFSSHGWYHVFFYKVTALFWAVYGDQIFEAFIGCYGQQNILGFCIMLLYKRHCFTPAVDKETIP